MIDWQASLYDPNYAVLGVAATLTPGSSAAAAAVTAIDKTAGAAVPGAGVEVESIRPAAKVRMAELADAGITRDDLEGGSITLNGATWKIRATRPLPSPAGEADGELLLILSEA